MKARILGLVVAGLLAGPMAAGAVTLNAVDSGWYDDAGSHFETNQNYIAGLCSDCGGAVYRNFFVFDLTGVGPVSSATLRLDTAIVETDGTYSLWDVLTSIASLTAGGSGLIATYNDLGSGQGFGSIALAANQDNTIIDIVLNADALASINAAAGVWAIGGSYDGALSAFFASNGSLTRQLVLTAAVPEPGTLALLGLGLAGLGLSRRRKA